MSNSKRKTQNSKLFVLLALYVTLATAYSLVTPLGEGPDEPGHAAYVFFLARAWRLPDQRANEVPGEGHQPPLAYALAVPALLWLPREQRVFDLPGNSRFVWAGGDQVNAVAHGSREFWPWQGEVLAWHFVRLVSVACGALTVAMTFLAARSMQNGLSRSQKSEVRSQNGFVHTLFPLLAAALVAFNPQFLFISGLISNDVLLAALGSVALWLCVRATEEGWPARSGNALALGVVLGLALLTKQSALVFVPMIMLAIVAKNWNRSDTFRSFRRSAAALFGIFAIAALISGWWYIRNWQLYGDPLGLSVFQAQFATQPFDFTNAMAWRDALAQLHNSFWARFGWMNVTPPPWVIWVFAGIELLAIVGWLTQIVRVQPTPDTRHPTTWLVTLIFIATTFAWVLAFARTAGLVAWQGRMLFPAASAIAILLAAGVNSLPFIVKDTKPLFFIIHFTLFIIALWIPFGVIRPAYPPQTLPEPVALANLGTPVYGRFGLPGDPGAVLRGYTLTGAFQPGATVQLQLLWRANGRQNRDWTVFVHLVDAREQIVAESNGEPRNGMFPMGQWVKGDWVEDTHSLVLPPNLAPGSYTLRVGLFDARGTQERAGVWNEAGNLVGDYLEVATVEVRG